MQIGQRVGTCMCVEAMMEIEIPRRDYLAGKDSALEAFREILTYCRNSALDLRA